MTPLIQLQRLPRRPMKPAYKRALFFWLATSALSLGSAALMVLCAP